MPAHVNFYENIVEARMRLSRTVVCYDGEPYYVLAISDHKNDGIFRIYLQPVALQAEMDDPCYIVSKYGYDHPHIGKHLDTWLDANPNSGYLRKQMNSPLFNKYRPFSLGMANTDYGVFYVERQPTRKSEQGLTSSMLVTSPVSLGQTKSSRYGGSNNIEMMTPAFRSCVVADHPSAAECLEAMTDPDVTNEAAAFHRRFAFVRGPIDMVFLACKENIVGVLPNNDFSKVRLGRNYAHTAEVVAALNLFETIVTN